MSRVAFVDATSMKVLPVDSTMAIPAASRTAPPTAGSAWRAMWRITVSEAARPMMEVPPSNPGNAARPVMARRARAVSSKTTPTTIPRTALRAAFSSLAEKNFW